MLRSGVDFRARRRDNTKTEHSADTPELGATRHPSVGGVPRDSDLWRLARAVVDYYGLSEHDEQWLRLIFVHVRDGGIVVQHAGSLVLTWPDTGVSRKCPIPPEV